MARKKITANQRTRLFDAAGRKCALCSIGLFGKVWHLDHIRPLEMGGADEAANWQCLCVFCHLAKTRQDVKDIALAKRRETKNLGATPPPRRPIQSQGFPKSGTKPDKLPLPPRRSIYQ